MNINCSSEATLPPANLTWYINQQPVGTGIWTFCVEYIKVVAYTLSEMYKWHLFSSQKDITNH